MTLQVGASTQNLEFISSINTHWSVAMQASITLSMDTTSQSESLKEPYPLEKNFS